MKHMKSLGLLMLLALVTGCAPAAIQPAPTAIQPAPTAMQAQADPTATPVQAEDATSWEVVLQTTVQHKTTVAGFLDESFGITAGYAGEMHYTNDGGETWPKAENASACRFGLDIVDEDLAWSIGNLGHVRVSTDGGQNWQAVSNLPARSDHVSFIDAATGWAFSSLRNQLWATDDGGQTWTEVPLPEDALRIVGISLRAAGEGHLLDVAGVLYSTQDGGQSWSDHTWNLSEGSFLSLPHTAAIRFSDADHGLIVLGIRDGRESKTVALRTADGGETWEQEDVSDQVGSLYLTRDGAILTIYDSKEDRITVLRCKGFH